MACEVGGEVNTELEIETATEILIALVNPVPGKAEEFSEWYSRVHIPEVLGLPEFLWAQRYEASAIEVSGVPFQFATIYAVSGPAQVALSRLFTSELGTSDTLDSSRILMGAFTKLGEIIVSSGEAPLDLHA